MEHLMNIMREWSEEMGKGLMGLKMKGEEEGRRREEERREVQEGFKRMEEEVAKVKGKVDEFFEDFKVIREKKKYTWTITNYSKSIIYDEGCFLCSSFYLMKNKKSIKHFIKTL